MNPTETTIQQLQKEHQYTISKISHEIRNPVTLINSFLQLLAKKQPEVTKCEYWEDIMENMEYLRTLLDELSDYNNSGRLSKKPVYMDLFLEKTAASVQPVLQYLDIHFTLKLRHPLPVMEIDEVKLRQVLLNLLRNAQEAIEPPGEIRLSAYTDHKNFNICIWDNGCEIPPEYLSTLFEPFVTHKAQGTGLGLSIAKKVTEAHGGNILVQSDKKGTQFTLRLPLSSSSDIQGQL